MKYRRTTRPRKVTIAIVGAFILAVTACAPGTNMTGNASENTAQQRAQEEIATAHEWLQVGEYENALDAWTRAALDGGLTPEILTGLGHANLGLGRLGQAETLLRQATDKAPDWPEAWNNLGVVLIERGKIPEAVLVFRKAYALDNGQSDSIRDNLRLALAKSENPDNNVDQNQTYKLVRRGNSDYVIRKAP